eukprot:g11808.t1
MSSVLEAMKGPIGVAFLTIISVLVVVGGVALCRKLCCTPSVNYTAVNHGLDEEEIAFKTALEAQNGGDDIDELFNFSGQEELEFDTNDLDNIEMLQRSRTNLGAPPSPREIETGLGKEGSAPANGAGGTDGRSSSGGATEGRGTLADTVQEAEDLEALLMGGAGNGGMSGQSTSRGGAIDPA